ncbi:hypothetical protein HID58_038927 [Brassica napus]|uniref:Uncharacterized protein n=2 Tax=Brassica napus TaxID=3708 RepID=A0ABQ8BQJ5_BRANA|nr:hypothetical protein HID58_038927 [Brassica napus]
MMQALHILCNVQFMTQEDDKAEAQEDEIVVKEPEVEKKQNWNRSLENRRRGSRKVSRIKRWIMLRTRTRKTAIKHYSKKALDISESERQKQEEGGCLDREESHRRRPETEQSVKLELRFCSDLCGPSSLDRVRADGLIAENIFF